MTNIVKLELRSQRSATGTHKGSAEIVIFPGVRYERLDLEPPKPAKRSQSKARPPLLRRG